MRSIATIILAASLAAACGGSGKSPAKPKKQVSIPIVPFSATLPQTDGERAVAEHFASILLQCQGGNAPSCRRLSQRFQFATGADEVARYAQAIADACRMMDVPVACGAFGWLLVSGIGVPSDPKDGFALLELGCDGGDDVSCVRLAEGYASGKIGKKSDGEALLRESCERIGGWPCAAIARKGKKAERRAGFENACLAGDPIACHESGLRYANASDRFPADQARASEAYRRACNADFAPACFSLAWQYRRGSGVRPDEARAAELTLLACVLGDSTACDFLAEAEAKDNPGANKKYCDLWGAQSCLSAGQLAKARERFTRACDAGAKVACAQLAKMK